MNINMETQELAEDLESRKFSAKAEERGKEIVGGIVGKIEKGAYVAVGAVAVGGAEALNFASENISRGVRWLKEGFEEIKTRAALRGEILDKKAELRNVKRLQNSEVRRAENDLRRTKVASYLENTWNTSVADTKNFFEKIIQSRNESKAVRTEERIRKLREQQEAFLNEAKISKENIDKNTQLCKETIENNDAKKSHLSLQLYTVKNTRAYLIGIGGLDVLNSQRALENRKKGIKSDEN